MEPVVFYTLAAVILIPAILTVTLRNIAHAAFWLMPTLLGVAGIFLVLGSEFLFAIQILLYVGAILVLLVFAIVLTQGLQDPALRAHNKQKEIGALVAVGLMAALWLSVLARSWGSGLAPKAPAVDPTRALGLALIDPSRNLLHFELASILLLAATIGAVVICRKPAGK
jgi:NADH-quinone oxidoreductase subunit J